MIFVTGGTGVLGSQLLFDLTQRNYEVRALYRSDKKLGQLSDFFRLHNPTNWKVQISKIDWVQGDILNIPLLREQLQGCTHIYHCAALISFHKADFNAMIQINRYGTANIVNLALEMNITKLCYVSSTAAIGGDDTEVISENTKWKLAPMTTGYSVSKYSAENEVWRGIEEGLNAVMVNPCVIIGSGNWNDSSLTLFRTLKKGMTYYPPGSNATVDSRDVSEIMIRLMASEITAERFLCIGSNQSFKILMDEISSQLNVKQPKKLAKRWLVNFARRILRLLSRFTRKRPAVTRESVQALFSNRSYDNTKVKTALDFNFRELETSIEFTIKNRIQ